MTTTVTLPVAATTAGTTVGVGVGLTEAGLIWAPGPEVETASAPSQLAWPAGFGQTVRILGSVHSRTFQQRYWVIETTRVPAKEDVKDQPRTRGRELRWLEENRGTLAERYGGQWIVLEGERLVSHHPNQAVALTEARRKGIQIPFIVRVRSRHEGPLALAGIDVLSIAYKRF